MIKAIIFDYYGVIATDKYLTWLERHPEIQHAHAKAIEDLSRAQDYGLTLQEFDTRLAKIADLPVAAVRDGLDIHGVTHEALIHFIVRLRRLGLKTAILSNSDIGLYSMLAEHHIKRYFDEVLCSEEAGVVKPDPKIFRMVLAKLGISPSEAIFVDDRMYNVEGAIAVGIDGIFYDGLTGLETELAKRDIVVPMQS
ncbi:MAG: HAD family hydrolase [Candidatus Saccharimonadia bacterium]